MSTNFEALILRDITGNRPAAGIPGRLFYDTTLEKWERDTGAAWEDCEPAAGGGGDVLGPATSADNAIARFNGTNNKTIQDSLATVDDSGGINIPTGQTYNINGSPHTHAGGAGPTTLYDNTLGSAGSWDVSGLSGSYDRLQIILSIRGNVAAGGVGVYITFNNDTTNTNYFTQSIQYGDGAVTGTTANDRQAFAVPASSADAGAFGEIEAWIPNYARTVAHKLFMGKVSDARSNGNRWGKDTTMKWANTAAINRIAVAANNADTQFVTGSRFQIIAFPA